MFADDLALYMEVHTLDDYELLHSDLTDVSSWSQRWQLQLNWNKYEAVNVTNKQNSLLFHIIYITISFNGDLESVILVLSLIVT